jgi:predicted nucleic acid-binding protein
MIMHKQKLYIDTSVIGGCFDSEFTVLSNRLFKELISGKYIVLISDLLIAELNKASSNISDKLLEIPLEFTEFIQRNEESKDLASKYIEYQALSNKNFEDAHHIALATINNANILVSWNFKHIVNINRISVYNSVNTLLNYPILNIRSPREVIDYGN